MTLQLLCDFLVQASKYIGGEVEEIVICHASKGCVGQVRHCPSCSLIPLQRLAHPSSYSKWYPGVEALPTMRPSAYSLCRVGKKEKLHRGRWRPGKGCYRSLALHYVQRRRQTEQVGSLGVQKGPPRFHKVAHGCGAAKPH